MLRKFIGERCFCGLDIGAQSIKASIIKSQEGSKPILLGVFETPTNGFKDASISDLADLTECVHAAIHGLVKRTGLNLKEVQLGIGGELIEARHSAAVIPLVDRGSKVISQRDVKKVQLQARLLGVNMDEVVLHDFPQYYKVDDKNTALNPIGLYGRKLEIKSMLVIVNNTFLKNLVKAVNQAGFDVAQILFSSFSSSESSLTDYQKKQGCVLIDIGARISGVMIYKEGLLKHLGSIPVGGEHVTRNISQELKLAFDLAENLKKSYAFASLSDARADEEILIKREDGYLPIKKEVIIHAVEPIVERFVESVASVIRTSGYYDQINVGIIMVGGGALLPGLPERIEKDLNFPVKVGKVNIAGKRLQNASKFSSVVGLSQLGMNKAFGLSSHPNGHSSFASSVVSKFKELYHEYF